MVTLLGKRLDKRMMGYCDSCRVLRLRYLFAVYWPLLRLIEALIEELSQLRVDTITPPEGLIHMLTVDRTCIVFFIDDLPYKGSNHTRPLYISIGCSGRHIPFVLLDNGYALNVCLLATTTIAYGFGPFDFTPSTQTVRAYDSTRREVLGTLTLDLLIGSVTFPNLF